MTFSDIISKPHRHAGAGRHPPPRHSGASRNPVVYCTHARAAGMTTHYVLAITLKGGANSTARHRPPRRLVPDRPAADRRGSTSCIRLGCARRTPVGVDSGFRRNDEGGGLMMISRSAFRFRPRQVAGASGKMMPGRACPPCRHASAGRNPPPRHSGAGRNPVVYCTYSRQAGITTH